MRILSIIDSLDPRCGGPVEGTLQLSAVQISQGHDVHIVSLDPPDAPFVATCPITLHALGEGRTMPIGWKRYLPWVHYQYAPAFVPWLRNSIHQYDAVIVNGMWNYAIFGATRALVGSGVPYVAFAHGSLDPWAKRAMPLKSIFKQISWWFNEGPLFNNANAVLFTTKEEMDLARGAYRPYRLIAKVVGHGTRDISGNVEMERKAFRSLLPALGDKPFLLYLSRIHPKKGADNLIEAWGTLCKQYPEIDLVVAGPDQVGWQSTLQKRAEELGAANRIHWPGMLPADAKWGALREAAAFILPSHQENFGTVVVEALACSTPTLITNQINIWHEIAAARGGLVETDDGPGTRRLIERFLSLSGEERAEMERNARACFLSHFEITTAVNAINKVISDACIARGLAERKTA